MSINQIGGRQRETWGERDKKRNRQTTHADRLLTYLPLRASRTWLYILFRVIILSISVRVRGDVMAVDVWIERFQSKGSGSGSWRILHKCCCVM